MFIVNSYNPRSKGAKRLAKLLRGVVYTGALPIKGEDVVINWGDSKCSLPDQLNPPSALGRMTNKRTAFDVLSSAGVPIPRYAKEKEGVTWSGLTVVRHKLTGHSGEGIELVEKKTDLPDAPLYVEYIKKEQEYRIHVGKVNGQIKIIAVQRKARNKSVPKDEVDWQIRNHKNGFVFVRQEVHPPDDVLSVACSALGCSGLDFGAVDVVWNAKEAKAYVLEINTAPGIEGTTIEDYANFFREFNS